DIYYQRQGSLYRCCGIYHSLEMHRRATRCRPKFLTSGERTVDLAIDDLKQCDIRIGVMHHPLDWLDTFDEVSVSSRLFGEFDLLACGHVHRAEPEFRRTAQGGALISQGGCLYETRDYFNGYNVIRLNQEEETAEFIVRTFYNRPRRKFDKAVNIVEDGKIELPYTPRSMSRNPRSERFLRITRPIIRKTAADHMNIVSAVEELRALFDQADMRPSLRAKRSNPGPPPLTSDPLDCFVASLLAMTIQSDRIPL